MRKETKAITLKQIGQAVRQTYREVVSWRPGVRTVGAVFCAGVIATLAAIVASCLMLGVWGLDYWATGTRPDLADGVRFVLITSVAMAVVAMILGWRTGYLNN